MNKNFVGGSECIIFYSESLMPTIIAFTSNGLADLRWMTWQISTLDRRLVEKLVINPNENGGKHHAC